MLTNESGEYYVYSLEKCIGDLEKDVKLEYDRTMNRMTFDKVVMNHPEEFSCIILPQKDPECVPQKGKTALYKSMWSRLKKCISTQYLAFILRI